MRVLRRYKDSPGMSSPLQTRSWGVELCEMQTSVSFSHLFFSQSTSNCAKMQLRKTICSPSLCDRLQRGTHSSSSSWYLEKEMATHSRILAWRIPGTGEPGGLPPVGSHRVRHDWRDLAVYCISETAQYLSYVTALFLFAWCIQGLSML